MRVGAAGLRAALAALCVSVIGCGDGGSAVGIGGAQDIAAFRAQIEQGELPDHTPEAAGFFSEHSLEGPDEPCEEVLCPRAMLSGHRDWTFGGTQLVLHVDMVSSITPETIEQPPLDLVLIVDTSASMAHDDRLEHTKDGLMQLVGELAPEDRVALVTYDSDVEIHANLAEPRDDEALLAAIAALEPEGSTAFYAGLEAGLAMAHDALDPIGAEDRASRAILVSDGVPSKGVIDRDEILAMADGYTKAGIQLSAIGVGADVDPTLLLRLAEQSGGGYYGLATAADIAPIFVEELHTLRLPIARNVSLTVTPSPGIRFQETLGAGQQATTTASEVQIDLPLVTLVTRDDGGEAEGDRRGGGSALFIVGTYDEDLDLTAVGRVVLRYLPMDATVAVEHELLLDAPLPLGKFGDEAIYSHETMIKSYAVVNAYLGLREAAEGARCNPACTAELLSRLDANLGAIQGHLPDDEDIRDDRELIQKFHANVVAYMHEKDEPAAAPGSCDRCGSCCYYDDVCSVATVGGAPSDGRQWSWLFAVFAGLGWAAWRRR